MSGEREARDPPRSDALPRTHLPISFRRLVEAETRRILADPEIAPDPSRLAEGWERRFIADDARVAEMVKLYQGLGYETVVDPIRPGDVDEECGDCQLVALRRLKVIYTRPGRAPHGA